MSWEQELVLLWVRYDRSNEKRTRRSMMNMSFIVVASTENNSRITSSFFDGSILVNDLWVAVVLESVPLRSTCWARLQTEPDAHHT